MARLKGRDIALSAARIVPISVCAPFIVHYGVRYSHEQLHLGYWAAAWAVGAAVLLFVVAWAAIVGTVAGWMSGRGGAPRHARGGR